MAKPNTGAAAQIRPRLRIVNGKDIALGPGKVELLYQVNQTGSIRKAAQLMKMSYMRAWSLIRIMNKAFKKPLIETIRGGQSGGGAQLTETGRQTLALYQKMEAASLRVIQSDWHRLRRLLQH